MGLVITYTCRYNQRTICSAQLTVGMQTELGMVHGYINECRIISLMFLYFKNIFPKWCTN